MREINLIARRCVGEMRVLLTVLRSGGTAGGTAHLANLLGKLGARDRVQAVIAAYETGLVRPGER